jgi:acetate CoA/acetoacetate CoA-transferase beta subunit
MSVIKVTQEGLLLTEYNPEYSVEEIQAATGARLIISSSLKTIA